MLFKKIKEHAEKECWTLKKRKDYVFKFLGLCSDSSDGDIFVLFTVLKRRYCGNIVVWSIFLWFVEVKNHYEPKL